MVVQIPDVLKAEALDKALLLLKQAEWIDGKATAGALSARTKNNRQLPESSPLARELGDLILAALERNALFISAALPQKIYPPLFNRYEGGEDFGTHVDNAIRQLPGTNFRLRTDLSATLFLTAPDSYDGGELCIEDRFGTHEIKLPAGHMVLYPASSLHLVRPVSRGARIASFFWIQSLVRDAGRRSTLFDLDLAIQNLNREHPGNASQVQLTGIYQNLVREWADL